MREHPILMSGPLVKAVLDGRKTQPRRLVKRPARAGEFSFEEGMKRAAEMGWGGAQKRGPADGIEWRCGCPFGSRGDRLWVRETWRPWIRGFSSHVQYRADDRCGDSLGPEASNAAMKWCDERGGHWDDGRAANPDDAPWFPSIHMPRWASRLSLDVLEVRVQRAQDISEEDAVAEGIADGDAWSFRDGPDGTSKVYNYRAAFAALWDSLAPAGSRWADNPFVWAITFARAPS